MDSAADDQNGAMRRWACASFFAAGLFLALLAALHPLKDEMDPSWHVISEYEIGRHGWIMSGAFLVLAGSCASLALALRRQTTTRSARVGLGLLWVTACGLVLAALGTADPITVSAADVTTHGRVHGFGAMLGIPGFLLAATLLSIGLPNDPRWRSAQRPLRLAAGFAWVTVLGFGLAQVVMYDGEYGPDVRIGWPNRLVVIAYSAWLLTTSARAARLAQRPGVVPAETLGVAA